MIPEFSKIFAKLTRNGSSTSVLAFNSTGFYRKFLNLAKNRVSR